MRIDSFTSFNENMYRVAARIVQNTKDGLDFSQPHNNDYRVTHAKITYPDNTILEFPVNEDIHSDIKTYEIRSYSDSNTSPSMVSINRIYLELFGSCIQFEDFSEYTLVRGYLNIADLNEHTFDGFIYDSESDSGFYEIKIKLLTESKGIYSRGPVANLLPSLSYDIKKLKELKRNTKLRERLLMKVKDHLLDNKDMQTKIDGYPIYVILYSNIINSFNYKYSEVCKKVLNYIGLAAFPVSTSGITDLEDLGELFY